MANPTKPKPPRMPVSPRIRREKWLARILVTLSILLGLAGIAFTVGPTLLGVGFLAWVAYESRQEAKKYDLSTRYYEVHVTFAAEGQAFEAKATIECRPYHNLRGAHYNRYSPRYVAKRLPSGAGILIHVPPACGRLYRFNERSVLLATCPARESTIPKNFLPVVRWFDSADHPTMIEAYISETYYASSAPRLKIRSISVCAAQDGTSSEPSSEIPWLGYANPDSLRGYYVNLIGPETWRVRPDIAAFLEPLTVTQKLEGEARSTLFRQYDWWWSFGKQGEGIGGSLTEWDNEPSISGHGARNVRREASRTVFPIRFRDGRFFVDTSHAGVVVYYPKLDVPRLIDVNLWLGEEPILVTSFQDWYYSAKTHQVLLPSGIGDLGW